MSVAERLIAWCLRIRHHADGLVVVRRSLLDQLPWRDARDAEWDERGRPRPPPPPGADAIERALRSCEALAPWFDGTATGTLYVAFSGGLDSTVLLHALRGVRGVEADHINHGIHPDSAAWAEHCRVVAGEFGITRIRCSSAHFLSDNERRGNVENDARRFRYERWYGFLAEGDVLALAHHADDQAETRLWQAFTGRQPWGMPAERSVGRGRLVRPLLTVRRRDIAAYAEHFGLRWIEDPSNADLDFDRNYIRHRVLPVIEARFPQAVERLATPRRAPDGHLEPLPAADASPWRIEYWLLAAGLPTPHDAMAEIQRQSAAARDRAPRVHVTPGVTAWRYDGAWHLVPRTQWPTPQAPYPAPAGHDLATPQGTLSWHPAKRGLPPDTPLTAHHRQGGERIRPDGRGVTKTVKSLFHERRIPPWQRDAWPLLHDAAGNLVAVPDLAIAEHAAVGGGLRPDWTPASTLTG